MDTEGGWAAEDEKGNRMKQVLAGLLLLPVAAFAVDGVREINQSCALAGCFSGDAPGFPVTIDQDGSYVLTGNLDVSGLSVPENRTAVDITALRVTLDMNGFSIIGPVSCTGTPVTSCTPSGGSGDGIQAPFATGSAVTIRNGIVRGMGNTGVGCGGSCNVRDVQAIENGLVGITNSNDHGVFINNTARRNGQYGFIVDGLVEGNTAVGNGGYGIFTNPGSRVIRNHSENNGGNGVRCFTCSLLDNVVIGNAGFGVELGGRAVYGRNLIDDNDMGELDGTAFAVDENRCGLGACP